MTVAKSNWTDRGAAISNYPQGERLAGPDAFLHCGAPQHDLRFRTQPNFRIRPTRLAGPVRWKRVVGCYGIAHLNDEPAQEAGEAILVAGAPVVSRQAC
jgi:hypothetical protein